MPAFATPRRSGIAAMLAGAILIAEVLLSEFVLEQLSYLLGLVLLLLLVALPGLEAFQDGRDGRLGRAGFVLAWIGAAILATLFAAVGVAEGLLGLDPDASQALGPVLAVGFVALIAGVPLFGIAALRAGVLPRAAVLLFVVSLPLGVAIDLATGAFFEDDGESSMPEIGYWVGVSAFAFAMIWLGHRMWSEPERSSARARSGCLLG